MYSYLTVIMEYSLPVTSEDVKQQPQKLNIFISAGQGNLHPRAFKELSKELFEPLLLIFNTSWNTGEIPVN